MSTLKGAEALPMKSLRTVYTDLPPSCVLHAPQNPDLIVVGTYYLDESATVLEEKKTGSLLLYQQIPSSDGSGNNDLQLLQTLPTQAILDIKFSPHDLSLLGVAQSLGFLSFYRLDSEKATFVLDSQHRLCDPTILVLALTFSPTSPEHLALTLSSGEVALFSLSLGEIIYQYHPHELEAWTCEFSSDGKTLYSGGDDSVFCAQSLGAETQLWKDRKTHQAGVTAILAREGVNNTILTGSYDEWLRVFDFRIRKVVEDVRLGGGVWRLHMRDENSVLASCMHAGARIVSVPDGKPLSVVAKFEEHESMNYGSHIHSSRPDSVVSCSFYDKRLCIWSIRESKLLQYDP